MPALVEVEISPWTQKERHRCMGCGKIAFESEERATGAAEKMRERVIMRVYFNDGCGWWHLTRGLHKSRRRN